MEPSDWQSIGLKSNCHVPDEAEIRITRRFGFALHDSFVFRLEAEARVPAELLIQDEDVHLRSGTRWEDNPVTNDIIWLLRVRRTGQFARTSQDNWKAIGVFTRPVCNAKNNFEIKEDNTRTDKCLPVVVLISIPKSNLKGNQTSCVSVSARGFKMAAMYFKKLSCSLRIYLVPNTES